MTEHAEGQTLKLSFPHAIVSLTAAERRRVYLVLSTRCDYWSKL